MSAELSRAAESVRRKLGFEAAASAEAAMRTCESYIARIGLAPAMILWCERGEVSALTLDGGVQPNSERAAAALAAAAERHGHAVQMGMALARVRPAGTFEAEAAAGGLTMPEDDPESKAAAVVKVAARGRPTVVLVALAEGGKLGEFEDAGEAYAAARDADEAVRKGLTRRRDPR